MDHNGDGWNREGDIREVFRWIFLEYGAALNYPDGDDCLRSMVEIGSLRLAWDLHIDTPSMMLIYL